MGLKICAESPRLDLQGSGLRDAYPMVTEIGLAGKMHENSTWVSGLVHKIMSQI